MKNLLTLLVLDFRTFEELNRLFASGIVPSWLQFDFKWKTCSLYWCYTSEHLNSWIVRLHLEMFLPYLNSISNEKFALFWPPIRTILIGPHLVKNKEHFTRVKFRNVWGAASLVFKVRIWNCSFKAIWNENLALFRLGKRTISIGPHLVKNTLLLWHFGTFEELNRSF
jgi:hypothetical protein